MSIEKFNEVVEKDALTARLRRKNIHASGALNYKSTKFLLAHDGDRNRIIEKDEMKKLVKANLAEGPVERVLMRAMSMTEFKKKPGTNFKEEDVSVAVIL